MTLAQPINGAGSWARSLWTRVITFRRVME